MPYLITTKERAPVAAGLPLDTFDVVSRRAVGTLDEAREEIWKSISSDTLADVRPVGTMNDTITAIGATGGTVGPLPDGTVVEVESFEWSQLARSCSPPLPIQGTPGDRWTDAEKTQIVDTYNAAQED